MGCANSSSSRKAARIVRCSSQSAIPAWGFHRSRRTRSLMHSLPLNLTVRAWAWDCGSAAPSLNRTGAACGLLTTLRAAQGFVSHYLPAARNATQLCRQIVRSLAAVTPTSRLVESIGPTPTSGSLFRSPTLCPCTHYSSRSRIIGSTARACRAGIQAATRPTASMVKVTPPRTVGSFGVAW
jgi:hypothetical protein